MAKINSNSKGKRGERELVRVLRGYGYTEVRRSQQYAGNTGEAADLIGLPGIHIEVKRTERLNVYDAIEQAERDTSGGIPTVFHRRNEKEWIVIQRLSDWVDLYSETDLPDKQKTGGTDE